MPTGIYVRTKEMKTGKFIRTEKMIINMSLAKLGKPNGMLGKHHSEASKEKMKQSHLNNPTRYWLGKKRNKEMAEKVKEKQKEWHKTHKHPLLGKSHSAATKIKIIQNLNKYYKEHPEYGKFITQKAHEKVNELFKNEEWKKQQIEKMLKNQKSFCISRPQIKLFNYVKNIFPDAVLNMILKTKRNYRYLDIAIPSLKIDIEYDEPYWHNMRKEDDIIRNKEIEEQGWKVIRFEPNILNFIK